MALPSLLSKISIRVAGTVEKSVNMQNNFEKNPGESLMKVLQSPLIKILPSL